MREQAQAIIGYVENACSEMAYEQYRCWKKDRSSHDKDLHERIMAMIATGVHDIPGSLADQFYSDPDFCEDLLGDRIYEEAEGTPDRIINLAGEIKRITGNEAMKKACDRVITTWKD